MKKTKNIEADKLRKEITNRILLKMAKRVLAHGEKRSTSSIQCMRQPELSLKEAKKIIKELDMKKNEQKFCIEQIQNSTKFDPRSFRTVKRKEHRITVGCVKNQWDNNNKRCKVPVQLQKILHPSGEAKCPIGGREIRKNSPNDNIIDYANHIGKMISQLTRKDLNNYFKLKYPEIMKGLGRIKHIKGKK